MRFFTSDQHFGHKNIIEYSNDRSSVAQMELAILTRFNDAVSENDDVYHLGDVSLDEHLVAGLMAKMRGRHHPSPATTMRVIHAIGATPAPNVSIAMRGLRPCRPRSRSTSKGSGVDLCHFPYRGDHTSQERYTELRPCRRGALLDPWPCTRGMAHARTHAQRRRRRARLPSALRAPGRGPAPRDGRA